MINDLASLVSQYGLAIVFTNVLVEQIGMPVPAIPTLMVAAALAVATRIGWLPFLAFNAAGGALWVSAGMGGGILLGSQIERLLAYLANYGALAVILVVAFLVGYVAFKWWERHRFYAKLRMARI